MKVRQVQLAERNNFQSRDVQDLPCPIRDDRRDSKATGDRKARDITQTQSTDTSTLRLLLCPELIGSLQKEHHLQGIGLDQRFNLQTQLSKVVGETFASTTEAFALAPDDCFGKSSRRRHGLSSSKQLVDRVTATLSHHQRNDCGRIENGISRHDLQSELCEQCGAAAA